MMSVIILTGCTSPEELERHLLGHWQQVEQNTTICTNFMENGLARRTTRVVNLAKQTVSADNGEAEKTGALQEAPQSENANENVTLTYEDGLWATGDGKRFTIKLSVALTPEGYVIPDEARMPGTSEFIVTSELGGDSFSAVNGKFQSPRVYNYERVEGCPFPEIPEYPAKQGEPE
jgi:hypothetical protein